MNDRAVVLLSGGLDSAVSLAMAIDKYVDILAITFNYGQKSFDAELVASQRLSLFYNIEHKVVDLSWLASISKSSLTTSLNVPEIYISDLSSDEITKNSANSVWVPNRNGLFVNIAACYAEALDFNAIIIGANKEEAGTFKDNSFEFIKTTNLALKNSTNSDIMLVAPLIELSKKQIIEKAIEYKLPFEYIHSCYVQNDKHCGKCESCSRLLRALKENNKENLIEMIFSRK